VTGAQAASRGHAADGGRGDEDVDALVTDHYLDSILAAHARGADAGPTSRSAAPNPIVRFAAQRLARDLPRLHPSFRFEEALAAKLSEVAAGMRLPVAAGGEGVIVLLGDRRSLPGLVADDGDDRLRLRLDPRPAIGRPLLIGGALTSAALSLAGAAYVAWRIRHPQTSVMARAVRAVARTRLA